MRSSFPSPRFMNASHDIEGAVSLRAVCGFYGGFLEALAFLS